MEFKVKTENFEGDINTLIKLIKKQEIEADKVKVYNIVSDLISQGGISSLEDAGDLLISISNLLELKTRLLLPSPPPMEDETEDANADVMKDLIDEVEEYKKFKGAAGEFKKLEDFIREFFPREADDTKLPLAETSDFSLGENVTLYDLVSSLKIVLHKAKTRTVEISRETLTAEEAKKIILSLCQDKAGGVEFFSLFSSEATRLEIIVIFLALLELAKQGQVNIKQEKQFEEIRVYYSLKHNG